jgi:predicted adenylyl cyclase CyaB
MNWFEVETKIPIKDVIIYREKIKKIATVKKKENKTDEYFAIEKKGYPKKAFRIRSINNNYVVNFKRWIKKDWTNEIVVKEEFEFDISNKENFLLLMKELGFNKWIIKIKESEVYTYKKDKRISIELNMVKHLGYFIEIEYLCKKNEISKAKGKINEVLKELGIKPNEIDNTGYTKLLFNKKILK